ncbi:MAG: F-box protein, partial [Nitrososphaerota archaeon]
MNNLNTEIIFNILQYLDIDDLINYSITNKLARNIFNDPYFWKKKILSLKIPDICLDYYKLNCTTYILLSAQEEKDICSLSKNFIPLKDFVKLAIRKNKLYLIKGLVKGSYCWDIALYEAGASNNKEIINHFLNISKNYEMILKGVIKSGNKNIFNEICKKYKPILDWQVLIEEAAYQGNKDFFEYIYLSKKNKWNWVKIVICAIKSGNPEFLHYIGILAQKNKFITSRFANACFLIAEIKPFDMIKMENFVRTCCLKRITSQPIKPVMDCGHPTIL